MNEENKWSYISGYRYSIRTEDHDVNLNYSLKNSVITLSVGERIPQRESQRIIKVTHMFGEEVDIEAVEGPQLNAGEKETLRTVLSAVQNLQGLPRREKRALDLVIMNLES